jgi:hypothetical protein
MGKMNLKLWRLPVISMTKKKRLFATGYHPTCDINVYIPTQCYYRNLRASHSPFTTKMHVSGGELFKLYYYWLGCVAIAQPG